MLLDLPLPRCLPQQRCVRLGGWLSNLKLDTRGQQAGAVRGVCAAFWRAADAAAVGQWRPASCCSLARSHLQPHTGDTSLRRPVLRDHCQSRPDSKRYDSDTGKDLASEAYKIVIRLNQFCSRVFFTTSEPL